MSWTSFLQYGVFLLQREIFYLKGSKNLLIPCENHLWKIILLKQCQSNRSTNHNERGEVHQTPKQICDWMAISWYLNTYQLININISSKTILLVIFTRRKKSFQSFSPCNFHKEKKNETNFFFLWFQQGKNKFVWKLFSHIFMSIGFF